MKTALQELMDWMEQTEFMVNRGFIDKIHECLEKEKAQIMAAVHYGQNNSKESVYTEGKDYYNETYENNRN